MRKGVTSALHRLMKEPQEWVPIDGHDTSWANPVVIASTHIGFCFMHLIQHMARGLCMVSTGPRNPKPQKPVAMETPSGQLRPGF